MKKSSILIYRLGSLGDTVVTLPCFHKIAEVYPDINRIVLTNAPVSSKAAPLMAILGGSGLIDEAISYQVGARSVSAIAEVRKQIRATGAKTLIYLSPARGLKSCYRDMLFFRLCGIRHIIGAPITLDLQRNRHQANGMTEQECRRIVRCLAPMGPINLDDPKNWDLNLSEAEWAAGNAVRKVFGDIPYIAINMGGKNPMNDWGCENWRNFLDTLGKKMPDCGLLVIGGPSDSERVGQVTGGWSGPVSNACGLLSPRESGAAMAKALMFVGHDSGPMHLAAAMGVRCIGLFGNLNPPGKWHPYGAHHKIIHNMKGIRAITQQDVLSAVCEILG